MSAVLAIVIAVGLSIVGIIVARGGLSGARYTITVREDGLQGVQIRGALPGYGVGEVAEFIAGLPLPKGARLWGIPEGDRIVLRFNDRVPQQFHQRLRNFFYLKQ